MFLHLNVSDCLQGDWWQVTRGWEPSANHINLIHACVNRASPHQKEIDRFPTIRGLLNKVSLLNWWKYKTGFIVGNKEGTIVRWVWLVETHLQPLLLYSMRGQTTEGQTLENGGRVSGWVSSVMFFYSVTIRCRQSQRLCLSQQKQH